MNMCLFHVYVTCQVLHLAKNQLTGSLPSELGQCAVLKVAYPHDNLFTVWHFGAVALVSRLIESSLQNSKRLAYFSEAPCFAQMTHVHNFPFHCLFIQGDVPASTFATGWKRIRKLTLGGNPKLSGITNVENALRQSRGPNKVDFSYAANDMVDTEGSLFNGGGVRRDSLQIVSAELKDDDEDS